MTLSFRHFSFFVLFFALLQCCGAFAPLAETQKSQRKQCCHHETRLGVRSTRTKASSLSTSLQATEASQNKLQRTGWAQSVLNLALQSPLWKHVLVPQARSTMVRTAEANGIPWQDAKQWLEQETLDLRQQQDQDMVAHLNNNIPDYYRKPFHAYHPHGNLCWEAAIEGEIASSAVGARNFPQFGNHGEDAFRGAFDRALALEAGANVPPKAHILDMGCGTGMSTRRLADHFPQAQRIQGVDLSPYFCAIGTRLLELEPKRFANKEGGTHGTWVSNISNDPRIDYLVADASNTGLPSNSFDVVNLQFVLHELPPAVAKQVVDEAFRLLKANGKAQLWVCEMDFEAPAYAEQRANALLFSLIRSTEPYLDDYAESIPGLFQHIRSTFPQVTVVPATGRHYALVATKGKENANNDNNRFFRDLRFHEDGTYKVEDTHLQVWESSKK